MNFKSNQSKSTFLSCKKYYSVVLLILLWGISPHLKATNQVQKSTEVTQQKKIIKGTVWDEANVPMMGVSVTEKDSQNGTITDINGNFELKVSNVNAKLLFSHIGYEPKELSAENIVLKIQLLPKSKNIDEVVVVGYANQKKQSVVGSIAQTTGDALKTRGGVTDLSNALSGAIPGVTVLTSDGTPGGRDGSDPQILIRGMNTWNDASPLILVDGVERSMNDIDINEVATVSVLKDASATAVFGVRGANGVILITTKQGNIGKPKINLEVNTAFKSVSKVVKELGSYDALLARDYALVNELPLSIPQANWNTYYTPDRILGYFKDQSNPFEYPNVDWSSFMLRPYTKTDKYSINISGGTDFVKYFTSIAYTTDGDLFNTSINAKGYTPEFSYKRYNFRTNLDFNLTRTTQFKVNLSGYYGTQHGPGPRVSIGSIMTGIYGHPPTEIPIYPDGIYGSNNVTFNGDITNVYQTMENSGTTTKGRTSLTSDFELTQKLDFITKGLTARAKYSYDNYFATQGVNIVDNGNITTKRFDIASNSWVITTPTIGSDGLDVFNNSPLGYTAETTANGTQSQVYYDVSLNYNRNFGKNNIGALALFSRQESVTETAWPVKRENWVARVTYNYAERYLVEVNGAYNGSDQFGPGHKFAFFPSFALGWRISEEKFIKDNIPQISNLKLKYSVGLVGNDNLKNIQWGYLTTWSTFPSTGNFQQFGYPNFGYSPYYSDPKKTDPSPVYVEGTPGNPNLQWEMSSKQNFGAELGLFDGLITGTADFFSEHRWDVLMVGSTITAFPSYVGAVASPANLGIINSHGIELECKIQKKIRKVNLWVSYNWTQAINNIVNKADPALAPAYQKKAGYPINQNNTLLTAGIIKSWDQMYTVAGYDGSIGNNKNGIPGDIYLVDFNSNGVIDKYDSAPNGYSSYPQNTYGFSLGGDYAGFSVMVQFYGAYNVTLQEGGISDTKTVLDRTFQPQYMNTNPDYPSLSIARTSSIGSCWNIDASYLRLKTAEISYTIPKKFSKKFSIDNMRFYVNGDNLLFWSKLAVDIEGKNPGINTNGLYPNSKNINLGLNVTF